MGGRRSIARGMLWMLSLLGVIALGHSRPSSGRSLEEGGVGVNAFLESPSRRRLDRARGIFREDQVRLAQKVQKEADDINEQWRMDWWSEQENAEEKENWKVFNTDKKALKQRWWEEDWKDDEWWSPKDNNTTTTTTTSPTTTTTTTTNPTTTTSRTKYSNRKKKAFCKLPTDCRKGRKCRRGLCVCLAEGECKGRKAVCGSDGVQYASHCELHRTACLTRRHIKVDRTADCAPPETTAPPEVTTAEDTTTTPTPTTNPTTTTTTTTTTTPTTTSTTTTPSTTTTTPTPESSSTTLSQVFDDNDDDDDDVDDEEDDDDDGFYNEDEDDDIFDDDDYEDDYEYYDEEYDEDDNDEEEEEVEEEEEEDEEEEEERYSNGVDGDSRIHLDNPRPTTPPEEKFFAQEEEEETTQRNTRITTTTTTKGDKKKPKKGGNKSKADDHGDSNNSQDSQTGENEGEQKDYDYQSDASSFLECSKKKLKEFKRELLTFYCQRFQEPDCKLEVKEERDYLSNLLFSYLDMNTDYQVSFRELRARQASPHLPELSPMCQLTDLIWNDDVEDIDGQLSLQEFAEAFAHLYEADKDDDGDEDRDEKKFRQENRHSSSSSSPSSPVVNIIPTLATVGNGLELKCGLDASGTQVVWKRHGVNIRDLDLAELLVLEDGSLFFSKMGVHHMGNYSCQDVNDPSILQVHSLKVQMPPIVKVSPHSQIQPSKADVRLRCHAEGVPRPSINWHMNHLALHTQPHRYSLAGNKEQLTIYEADYQKDTGAYKCVARNQAGTAQDLASVFIIGDKDRTMGMGFTNTNAGKFAVFHSQGYTTYDPNDCLKHSTVHGDFGYFKFIPDSLDRPLRLCEVGGECVWGQVVNVRNSLLYVTQPALNRVVVIETAKNWIPVQVIATDRQPMQVYYVPQLDQVWVVCWNGEGEESNKTMVVVRDASKYIQHRVVHTQPVGNRFDQIQALFIAPANDLQHTYDYGYVTHSGQQTLTKVDLDNMRYVNTIHLSAYDCVPHSLAFVPIGGHVVVECVSSSNHQTLQLVLDYLTDAVVSTGLVSGRPHVSPDSRHVVTVDDLTGKVSVAGVSNEGTLEAAYEVTVSASISDVAFFPALGHGYLLVLTSADDDDIITINLSTGKVDKMKGTNRRATSSDWYPSPVKRAIMSGDVFSDFLLAPSKSSLSIMAMNRQRVQCEYPATPRVQAAVFVRR